MKTRPPLRHTGAVLVGLTIAVLLLACEEPTRKPAAPAQPAAPPAAEPATPAQSNTCVPNVAIHRTNVGGAIQGAIKDLVLYWGGTRSNVECLPEAQGSQRQFNRVGNTQGGTATYRVIRVQRPAGARYYMLKYLDGEPVCIIDVAGACDRMLSGLGDYDVETLPAEVPALDGSPAPPPTPAPAPAPPQSTVPPEVVTGGTAYVVGTQATLGAKAARGTRAARSSPPPAARSRSLPLRPTRMVTWGRSRAKAECSRSRVPSRPGTRLPAATIRSGSISPLRMRADRRQVPGSKLWLTELPKGRR